MHLMYPNKIEIVNFSNFWTMTSVSNIKKIFWKGIANQCKMEYPSVMGVVDTFALLPCNYILHLKIEARRCIFKCVAKEWSDRVRVQLSKNDHQGNMPDFWLCASTNCLRKSMHVQTYAHTYAHTCVPIYIYISLNLRKIVRLTCINHPKVTICCFFSFCEMQCRLIK